MRKTIIVEQVTALAHMVYDRDAEFESLPRYRPQMNPEDGSSFFLRNVGTHLQVHMEL
jgi:hypothetical protein